MNQTLITYSLYRRQTRRVPAIVVAAPPPETKKFSPSSLPSRYQFQVEQVTPTAENLLPKDEWRTAFRTRFDGIKESFSHLSKLPNNEIKLPAAKDKKQWKEFLYGAPKTEESDDQKEGHNPDVNILQRISQNIVLRLLNWHIEWLENNEIQKNQAMWMYALLTRLDKVMTSDETSILRNVSRKCIQIRQEQADPENPQVAYLNILITIIATCFGQADLV
ncbi:survival motor neuron interacting protein 1-domain-containing protein [Umbelopsis sp. AD052]|nr:survival motor neuron interacting protein 1-domain-containing protein [Umbelopsis sp. AD052]